jgi:DNA-binding transcriptional regulator of glucitol operon
MASDKVPEGVRISYALNKLKAQMRGSSFKEAFRADGEEFAFEGDQKGAFVVDGVRTLILREDLQKKIEILENRLVAIYNPHKEAEQDGTGQPATRPESKSEGSDKPQPESEGRSR